MLKKLLSALLTLALLVSLVPGSLAAEIEIVGPASETEESVRINPLYRDLLSGEALGAELTAAELCGEPAVCVTVGEAAAVIRAGMKARQTSVVLRYTGVLPFPVEDALELALSHTGDPREGDYLRFQYGGWGLSASGGVYTFRFSYFTDAEQEAEMDAAVDALLSALALSGRSDYEKTRLIYDYVCEHVAYDDYPDSGGDLLKYTAYGALINGRAVCQGYTALLYRLLLEAGVDNRVITGGNHAWTIIGLDGLYYNADATWDAGKAGAYSWFLKCMAHFPDHEREAPYSEAAFCAAYPMSDTDYAGGTGPELIRFTCDSEVTLWVGGEPFLAGFAVDPSVTNASLSCSYPGGGVLGVAFRSNALELTPLAAGGGIVSLSLKDKTSGATLDTAELYVTILPEAPGTNACGDDLTWTLDAQGTLRIEGTGPMWDFETAPWYGSRTGIRSLVLDERMTGIGDCAFLGCVSLTELRVPAGVTRLGRHSFRGCTGLTEILFEGPAPAFGENCFLGVSAAVSYPCGGWREEDLQDYGGSLRWEARHSPGQPIEYRVEPSCTDEGVYDRLVLCEICGAELSHEHTVIPARGHDWGEPAYLWAEDNSAVRASRVCRTDPEHSETETAPTSYEILREPTAETEGLGRYTAVFTNQAFEKQTKDVRIPPLGGYPVTVDLSRVPAGVKLSLENGALYSGETSFTVSDPDDRAVLVAVRTAEGWEALPCISEENGVHRFTVTVSGETELALLYRGDVNADGRVNMRDGLAVKKHVAGTERLEGLPLLAANANGDAQGAVNMRDGLAVKKDVAGTERLPW